MDQKMSDPQSSSPKMLIFYASVTNDFIVKKEWEDLDDYLGKFVATILKKTPDEVVMMHPGLFMIPREERLLDMLSDRKFEEADSFCQKSIELLRGCHGRFVALDLIHKIDKLNTAVKTSSMPIIRRSVEDVGTRISDYIHLYFPSVLKRRYDAKLEGLWQFAMELPKPDKQGQTVYPKFRCLACGWVSGGQCSILHQRSHFLQSSRKSCPKVTQDLLDRLRAIDETRGVPTLEKIKDKFSKKRKSALSNIVCWVSGSNISSSGSNTSCAGKSKRPRVDNSLSLDTPTSQMKPQLPVSLEPTLSDKVTNPCLMTVGKLSKENAAILGRLTPSVVPDGADRLSITDGVVPLHRVIRQLRTYAQVHANHPAPEELAMIVRSLEQAADSVYGRITAAVVPDIEDKWFLMRRVATVLQMVLEISISI